MVNKDFHQSVLDLKTVNYFGLDVSRRGFRNDRIKLVIEIVASNSYKSFSNRQGWSWCRVVWTRSRLTRDWDQTRDVHGLVHP